MTRLVKLHATSRQKAQYSDSSDRAVSPRWCFNARFGAKDASAADRASILAYGLALWPTLARHTEDQNSYIQSRRMPS